MERGEERAPSKYCKHTGKENARCSSCSKAISKVEDKCIKIKASEQDHLTFEKQFQISNSGTKKMEQASSAIFCLSEFMPIFLKA